MYQQLISDVTGVKDPKILNQIEDVMRNDILHSTLDWQTRGVLKRAALEARQVVDALNAKPSTTTKETL